VTTDVDAGRRVQAVLDALPHDAPSNFVLQDPKHMEAAKRFMATLRLNTASGAEDPPEQAGKRGARKRGPRLNGWSAAAGFAKCFKIVLPKRERDARRSKL
jgi:hypothetical protein